MLIFKNLSFKQQKTLGTDISKGFKKYFIIHTISKIGYRYSYKSKQILNE